MPNSKHLTHGISNLVSLITKTKLGLSLIWAFHPGTPTLVTDMASIPSSDPTPSIFLKRDNDFDIWDLPDDNAWFMWGLLLIES
jgi:hypothetical protein